MERQIHIMILILISTFEVWMCYQILYQTVLEKENLSKWQKILIWGNIIIAGVLMGVNRKLIFFSRTMFVFAILFTLFCSWVIDKRNSWMKAELVVFYYTLLSLVDFFCGFIGIEIIGRHFLGDVYLFTQSILQCVLFLLPRVCVAFLIMKWNFYGWYREYHKSILWICVGMLILLRVYQQTLGHMALGSFFLSGWTVAGSMVLVAILTSCIFVVYNRFAILKKENEMLFDLAELSKKHVKDLEQIMEKNRIQTHDMKNHLLVLQEYGKKEEWKTLMAYLNEISQGMYQRIKDDWTRIAILDMLLNQKKAKAELHGITFSIKTNAIGEISLTDTEICALFGNLLDNAIEACEKIEGKNKWIEICITKKANMLYIMISNSVEDGLSLKKDELITQKHDKELHGYGIKIVRNVVRKHNGDFEYQIYEKKFIVTIKFWNL